MASSKTPRQQLAEETYKNWLKGVLVTRQLKEGIQCFLQTELEKIHARILSVVQARILPRPLPTSCTCSSADLKRIRHICPLGICNLLLQEITARHQYGVANLHDTDPTKWLDRTQPWEVSKCYLSNGYRLVTSAAETDCTGLLSLVINCTTLHGKLHENVAVQPNLFTKVRDLRNATMHSPDLSLEEAQLKDLMKKALAILGDKIALKHDVNCQAAAARITEIQSGALAITLQDELIVLEEIRKASENISTVQEIKKRVEALELIKADVTHVKTDVGQVTTRICNVETDVGQIKTDVNNVSTDAGYVKTDVNEVKTDVLQVTTQIRKMETDVGQVKTDVGRVKTDVGRVKTDVGQVKTDVGQVKADVGQVKTQVGQVKTDMGQAKADVGQVKTDMGQVKTQVDQAKTDVGQVKTQVGQVKTDIGQVKTDVGQVKTEVGQVKTHIRKMEMDVGQVKTDVNEVKREIDQVSANVGQVKTDIGQIKTHGAKVQTDLFLVKTAVGQVNTDIRKVKQNVGKVKTHISKMETDVNAKLCDFKTIVRGVKTGVDQVKTDVDLVKQQPLVEYIKSQQTWLQITPGDEMALLNHLVQSYKDFLSTIVVSEWSDEVSLDDVYTPLLIRRDLEREFVQGGVEAHRRQVEHNLASGQEDENKLIQSFIELFVKDGVSQSEVYLIGKAGIGKTTLTCQILNWWSKAKMGQSLDEEHSVFAEFDYVFYTLCRKASKNDTIQEMVVKQNAGNDKRRKSVTEHVLESSQKSCLIIVDGLDEWAASATDSVSPISRPGVPNTDGLTNCVVLTTSRPWRVAALPKGLGRSCRVLEIVGLNKKGVASLSRKILKTLISRVSAEQDLAAGSPLQSSSEASNSELDKSVRSYVETEVGEACIAFLTDIEKLKMNELVKIPLMLTYFVVIWRDNGQTLDRALCMNYAGMIESLLSRAVKKQGLQVQASATESSAHQGVLPNCFRNRSKCLKYQTLILTLSKIAFRFLLCEVKENSLVFSKRELVEQVGETCLEECFKLGLLSQSKSPSKSGQLMVSVSFVHKSVQEFLAALWMSGDNFDSCFRVFTDRCKTLNDVFDFHLVIVFLSGLVTPDRGSELCRFVLSLVDEDSRIQQYRQFVEWVKSYFYRSKEPLETVIRVQDLLSVCSREVGYSLDGTQSVIDVVPTRTDQTKIPTAQLDDQSKPWLAKGYIVPDIYVDAIGSAQEREILYRNITLLNDPVIGLQTTEKYNNATMLDNPTTEHQTVEKKKKVLVTSRFSEFLKKIMPKSTTKNGSFPNVQTQDMSDTIIVGHDECANDSEATDFHQTGFSFTTVKASCIQSLVFVHVDTPLLVLEAVRNMTHLKKLQVIASPQQVEQYINILCQTLSHLKQLQTLGLSVSDSIPSVPLKLVKTLLDSAPNITSLCLGCLDIDSSLPLVTVAGASQAKCQCPISLQSLRLDAVKMSSHLLSLFPTRSLRSMYMRSVELSHTQIEVLCGCLAASKSLERLVLYVLSCNDCGDQCRYCLDLSALKQLKTLKLDYLFVTRLSLDPSELETLALGQLSGLETWEPVLTSLTQAPKLRRLQVWECSLSPSDVSALVNILPNLSQLEVLALSAINFADQETVTTPNMSQLREIYMEQVTMCALSWRRFLQTLPRHQIKVGLHYSNVDEGTLDEIRSCPRYQITHPFGNWLDFQTVSKATRD